MPHIYCNSDLAMKDRKLATTKQSNQNKTRHNFFGDPLLFASLSPLLVINHWSNNEGVSFLTLAWFIRLEIDPKGEK